MMTFTATQSEECSEGVDTSLTSLNWLLNLRVLDLVTPNVAETKSSISEEKSVFSPNKSFTSSAGVSLSPVRKCLIQCAEYSKAPRKYRTDSCKPPFSDTALIYLAIKQSKTGRVTLSEILKWIRVNFKFYRVTDLMWESSIRHNLLLNDLFIKVAHDKECWRLNPDYPQTLQDTINDSVQLSKGRKRALSTSHDLKTHKMRKRRIKSESTRPADPCGLPGDLDWVSLLSSQRVGCHSCPSESCRPSFGSPVLGTPDLGHIGEPVVCSPLVASLAGDTTAYPPMTESNGALLEEAVLKQDSPPFGLLPWDDGQSQSPTPKHLHPWAESKEKTLYELRNLSKRKEPVSTLVKTSMWSPDSSWSSSSTYSNANFKTTTAPLLSEACIY